MSLDFRLLHQCATRRIAGLVVLAFVLGSCGDRSAVTTPVDVAFANPAAAPDSIEVSDAVVPTTTSVAAVPLPTTTAADASTTTTTTTTTADRITSSTAALAGDTSTTVPSAAPTVAETTSTINETEIDGWTVVDEHLATVLDAGSKAISATVLRDGDVVHEMALGRRAKGDEVEVGDRYRIASISKVITAITALQLVEEGLIDLDVPVGDRLAARVGVDTSAAGVEAITPRHLLTHRSGIGQYENLMFARQVESCAEAGAVALGQNLERAPGTTMNYSNVNFCLLGELIHDVTGESYAEVVNQQLLDPLDISGMRLAGTFDVADGDVRHKTAPDRNYMEVLDAAGSWIASPTDVVTIIDSLDHSTPGWKPLEPDTQADMMTITTNPPIPPAPAADAVPSTETTVPPPPPTSGYGMGLMIFGPDSFGHTGTLESTHAMTVRQADGLTWAITVSGDAPWSTRDLARTMGEALELGFG